MNYCSSSKQLNANHKKIIIQLTGGLGNQMFQYATARALALRSNSDLILDTWSGFVRDFQYKRNYELNSFDIFARYATPYERMPFWFDRLRSRLLVQSGKVIEHHHYGDLLKEMKLEFLSEVAAFAVIRRTYMLGYWQSAAYFDDHRLTIMQELKPLQPKEDHFVELGKKMRSERSVALGIRLYEESNSPGLNSVNGRLKSAMDLNEAARRLAQLDAKLHFFIFCTHRASFLDLLSLPGEVTYVTPDDGFEGTCENLWLLTQCRHHIITNSSFYWWGAWLSNINYPSGDSEVFAADNFINKDTVLPKWNLF
jgi:hypothetical protein